LYKKILVALDGSKHANNALLAAIDLAEKYSSRLVLLTVFNPVYIKKDMVIQTPQDTREFVEAQRPFHEKVLVEALEKSKKINPKLKVATKMEMGKPAEKIIETAKNGKFDIIVIGSRGLGGIKQLLLGSVSDKVADEAPCPVLIVK
jgi:nucleotide-binding universal stress UspA family protein